MKCEISEYIMHCDVCNKCKDDNIPFLGLLQPLAIPDLPWSQISMDFIEELLNSVGKKSIWVIVDNYPSMAISLV